MRKAARTLYEACRPSTRSTMVVARDVGVTVEARARLGGLGAQRARSPRQSRRPPAGGSRSGARRGGRAPAAALLPSAGRPPRARPASGPRTRPRRLAPAPRPARRAAARTAPPPARCSITRRSGLNSSWLRIVASSSTKTMTQRTDRSGSKLTRDLRTRGNRRGQTTIYTTACADLPERRPRRRGARSANVPSPDRARPAADDPAADARATTGTPSARRRGPRPVHAAPSRRRPRRAVRPRSAGRRSRRATRAPTPGSHRMPGFEVVPIRREAARPISGRELERSGQKRQTGASITERDAARDRHLGGVARPGRSR